MPLKKKYAPNANGCAENVSKQNSTEKWGKKSHLLMATLTAQKRWGMRCFMERGSEGRTQPVGQKSNPMIKKKHPKNE